MWALDPEITFLNHGSFGACPRAVLEVQDEYRRRMEENPMRFLVRELTDELNQARDQLADFVGVQKGRGRLGFVPNATTGVNAVLRSFPFEKGDEILTHNHAYNACRNAAHHVAEKVGGSVRVVEVSLPIVTEDEVVEAILQGVTDRTRLALLDHITSPTALILPLARLVAELQKRGVVVLVDGAHAPGMLDLNLDEIGADFYTGNCHKWLCAPKGAAFLYVAEEHLDSVRPTVVSHGANAPAVEGEHRFDHEFAWTGTDDYSPYLCVPHAIRCIEKEIGWSTLRESNHKLCLEGQSLLKEQLGIPGWDCPEDMIGSMALLPLPDGPERTGPVKFPPLNPLQRKLAEEFQVEVPILPWPTPSSRLLRISAQHYNRIEDYQRLAEVLQPLLP